MLEVRQLYFKPLTVADKPQISKYFTHNYMNSEATFTYHYLWRHAGKTVFAEVLDTLVLVTNFWGVPFTYPPFGSGDIAASLAMTKEHFNSHGHPLYLRAVTTERKEAILRLYPNLYAVQARDSYDYFYDANDLRTLGGRKYMQKRNHLHAFLRDYPHYQYRPLMTNDIEECLAFTNQWLADRDSISPVLSVEVSALSELLKNYEQLGLTGGVITIQGRLAAFTLGERLNSNTVVIHVEKAKSSYRGLYQAINKDYLNNHWPDVQFVNREEDMGEEGLRKSKLSYHPIALIEKWEMAEVPPSSLHPD